MPIPESRNKILLIILAFFLFFVLLVTALIFLVYAVIPKKVSPTDQVSPTPTTSNIPGSTGTPNITASADQILTLQFKSTTFAITGNQADTSYPSYWAATPQTKEVAGIDELYQFFGNSTGAIKGDLFYISAKDTFYNLEPSGHASWSIVDEAYITKNTGSFTKTIDASEVEPTNIKTTCSKGLRKAGNEFFTSLECKEVYSTKIEGKETIVQETYLSKCLFNYSSGKYLMFSQNAASAGSDKDSCGILNNLGLQNIEIIK